MLINLILWLVMALVTLFLAWLAVRAWRSRRWLVKLAGGIPASLLTLVLAAVTVVAAIGLYKLYAPRNVPVSDLKIEASAEQVARGQHLADAFCTGCHTTNNQLPLVGGLDMARDIPIPLGSFLTANLTPAGALKDWSDGEIFRALRFGLDRQGRPLMIMTSNNVKNLSDEDMHALIAFIRSQPAAGTPTTDPHDKPNLLAAIMLGAGLIPAGQTPPEGVVTAPPKEATPAYGEYILSYQDCRSCHGADLRGGKQGQLAPIGPPLSIMQGWTQAQFIQTMRTGVDPAGHQIQSPMPWQAIGRLDDTELAAMYLYLKSVQ